MNNIDTTGTRPSKNGGKQDFNDVYNHINASRYVNSLLKLAYRDPDYLERFLPLIDERRVNRPPLDRLRAVSYTHLRAHET